MGFWDRAEDLGLRLNAWAARRWPALGPLTERTQTRRPLRGRRLIATSICSGALLTFVMASTRHENDHVPWGRAMLDGILSTTFLVLFFTLISRRRTPGRTRPVPAMKERARAVASLSVTCAAFGVVFTTLLRL